MARPTEVFDDAAAFRAALQGRRAHTAARTPGEGDRLQALRRIAVYGFMPRWRMGIGHDFWHLDGRSTTAHEAHRAYIVWHNMIKRVNAADLVDLSLIAGLLASLTLLAWLVAR